MNIEILLAFWHKSEADNLECIYVIWYCIYAEDQGAWPLVPPFRQVFDLPLFFSYFFSLRFYLKNFERACHDYLERKINGSQSRPVLFVAVDHNEEE